MSDKHLRKIQTANPAALLKELLAPEFKLQIANRTLVTVKKQALIKFSIAGPVFQETFLVLLTMGTV